MPMAVYAERMATVAVRSRSVEAVRTGIYALGLAIASTDDFRKVLPVAALLYRSAERLGADPPKVLGCGSFGAQEFFGITSRQTAARTNWNIVWYTKDLRGETDFPHHLVPVYATGDGELICLDHSRLAGAEAPLVAYWPGFARDAEGQRAEVAPSFGSFFPEEDQ